ncbi:MAG: hypothetical protein AAGI66_07190 [Cyanobacteria bacterium P01_H01_bin.74]
MTQAIVQPEKQRVSLTATGLVSVDWIRACLALFKDYQVPIHKLQLLPASKGDKGFKAMLLQYQLNQQERFNHALTTLIDQADFTTHHWTTLSN